MTSALGTYLFAFELGPAIVQSVPVIVIGLEDNEGKILYATSLAAKMFGYSDEEMLDITVEDLIPNELTREKHKAHRADYRLDAKTRTMNEGVFIEAKHKDGDTFFVQISLAPRVVGGRSCVIACMADVTHVWKRQRPDIVHH